MATFDTYRMNKTLTDLIDDEREKLTKEGKLNYESGATADVMEVSPGVHILTSDAEKYTALNLLFEKIDFKDKTDDELYVIPGLKMNGKDAVDLVIPISQATALADKADYLESSLSYLGIKFPSQLHQLKSKYNRENLPGRTFPAPKPRKLSQTEEDYERSLEVYYIGFGGGKTSDGISFRLPYPHEKVDYSKGNVEDPKFRSEYYETTLAKNAKGTGRTIPAPVGEKIKVTLKSLKEPSKDEKDKVKKSIDWAKVKSMTIKLAAVAAGVLAAGAISTYNPIGSGIILGAGALFALTRYIKNRRARQKAREAVAREEEEKKKPTPTPEPTKDKTKTKEKEPPKPGPGTKKGDPVPPVVPKPNPTGPTEPTAPIDEPVENPFKYDIGSLLDAEEELGLDGNEFDRIEAELSVVRGQIYSLSSTGASEEDLRALKIQEIQLLRERLEITRRLVERQERILAQVGAPSLGR